MKILEKKLSILLFLFFNLILFEIFSFVFFSINDERLKFNLYKKKYLGNSNYFFSKEVGLVFSKPDNEVVHFTSEFVDIFKTKNIFKNYLHGNKVYPFIVNEYNSDIDNLDDFKKLKKILNDE